MHILNKKNYKNHASEVEEKNIEQDLLLTKKQKSEKGCRSPKRGYRKDAAIELLNIIELLQKPKTTPPKREPRNKFKII